MSEKGARGGHHTAHLPSRRVVRRAASSREVDAPGFLAPMHVGQNWNGVTIRQLGGEVDFFWGFRAADGFTDQGTNVSVRLSSLVDVVIIFSPSRYRGCCLEKYACNAESGPNIETPHAFFAFVREISSCKSNTHLAHARPLSVEGPPG
jgi:hypothetical protein